MGSPTQRCLLLGGLVMVRGVSDWGARCFKSNSWAVGASWVPTRHLAVVVLESQTSSL